MKVLLCGGSGLVGRVIIKIFNERNEGSIIGTYNTKKYSNCIKLNFIDTNKLEKKISEINPDICISNIAERQNETCEKEWNKIKKVNIDIPYNLSVICKKLNIFLVHISTDCNIYDNPKTNTNPYKIMEFLNS